MTTEIQQNRYDSLLRRVGGLIGPGSKVSEVISELFPMIDVENVPGELLVLAGTRICFGGADVGGVALNISRVQLFNPPDSGVIVAISKVLFGCNNANTVRWGIRENLPLTTNSTNGVFRDTRLGITDRATAELRVQSTNPSLAPNIAKAQVLAGETTILEDGNSLAVLSPGFGWEISPNIVNTDIVATIFWRERTAEQSELNF